MLAGVLGSAILGMLLSVLKEDHPLEAGNTLYVNVDYAADQAVLPGIHRR
jgi:hypothetical protein